VQCTLTHLQRSVGQFWHDFDALERVVKRNCHSVVQLQWDGYGISGSSLCSTAIECRECNNQRTSEILVESESVLDSLGKHFLNSCVPKASPHTNKAHQELSCSIQPQPTSACHVSTVLTVTFLQAFYTGELLLWTLNMGQGVPNMTSILPVVYSSFPSRRRWMNVTKNKQVLFSSTLKVSLAST